MSLLLRPSWETVKPIALLSERWGDSYAQTFIAELLLSALRKSWEATLNQSRLERKMEALMKIEEPTITTYEAWVNSPYMEKARKQGWRLSFLSGDSITLLYREMTIRRSVTSGVFNTDEEAYEFVKQQAEKGDKLALTALNILLIEKLSGG